MMTPESQHPLFTVPPHTPRGETALEYLREQMAQARKDPSRPQWHFRPPAAWMNDPNGTHSVDGWYHLFYQHNPCTTTNPWKSEHGGIHWGHARSRNLVDWEHCPVAVEPDPDIGEAGCYSGSALVRADGRSLLCYTSFGGFDDEDGSTSRANDQRVLLGSDDRMAWEHVPENPVITVESHGGAPWLGDMRDPCLFHDGDHVALVVGARSEERKFIALFEAADDSLVRWTYRGNLVESENDGGFYECPNLYRAGEAWVLHCSPYGCVTRTCGVFDREAAIFTATGEGLMDHSRCFYAGIPFNDLEDDRAVVVGWVKGFSGENGWNGCLSAPREVRAFADGRFEQKPVREMELLREGEAVRREADLAPASPTTLVESETVRLDMSLRLDPPSDGATHLRLVDLDGAERFACRIESDRVVFGETEAPLPPLRDGAREIRLLLDRSVVECFFDDAEAYTFVSPELHRGCAVVVEAEGRGGRVASIAWPLRAAWDPS